MSGSSEIASVLTALGSARGHLPAQLRIAQQLIEALPVPVFFKDRDGRYLGVNQAWESFFGVSREAIVGKPLDVLYPKSPAVAETHRAMDERLWRAPGNQQYEITVPRSDGALRHTIYYKATFTRGDGVVAGLIGTIIDITERKQAEQRQSIEYALTRVLADARGLNEAVPAIIRTLCEGLGWVCGAHWVVESEANVLRCVETWGEGSPETERFLEHCRRMTLHPESAGLVRRAAASGLPAWIADVTEDKGFLRAEPAAQARLRSGFAMPMLLGREVLGVLEFFGREARYPVEWVLEVAGDLGRRLGEFVARKQAEEALRAAHASLERKAEDLARSNADLEQFAYVASHDLQEPLRMIASYTQLLERRYGERFDGDAKEFMAFVVDGAARMKLLIEDLLAYSRLGTHGKLFQRVPAEAVLAKVLANLRLAIEQSGATVTHDALPEVVVDDVQWMQLLQNLIGNALKFRAGAPPAVHVGVEDRGVEWLFAVRDNGIGIEPQYFERIFLVFQRLSGRGEYPGTGIGLAICKKVVERHGGRIWVESRPGAGSSFFFTLPKRKGDVDG